MDTLKNCDNQDRVYCYHDTNVLKNKFGITNYADLQDCERLISGAKQNEILKIDVKKVKLDFEFLKSINRQLFSEIYDWAAK